ncbi:MAG: hypothetical protein LC135_17095 [Phycisphaerae bacterium]|jgi:hypothetical protein|nr:hypothetical protein [Phycisphaerae bacterium]MCZ2401557.1 hypothetical protein [Phycisphaerae bacterium]
MLPRGYEFVEDLSASDVIIAVDPSGGEVTLYGAELLSRTASPDARLKITRIPVSSDDGEMIRLATRVFAIKGACDYDAACGPMGLC